MIGKVMKGRGFAGLARYLETGRDGNSPDRVEWTRARNLPTHDPHTASLLMRATAAQSARVEKPVYHVALSFDPDDGVDQSTMVRAADRLLSDLGLQEYQALIVAHGDTRHGHVHLMINRVHPGTFRAWDPKRDYAHIERSLREQERELALRAVPGHHFRLDGQERPDRSNALADGSLRRWQRTGELPFDELVRRTVRRDVASARSWEQLEARLAENGLHIEARGRGLVVTDGKETVKASSVARELSRLKLEQRFGAMHGQRHDTEPLQPTHERPRTHEAGERAANAAARDDRAVAEPSRSTERDGGNGIPGAGRDNRSFGQLRGTQVGPVRSPERNQALRAAGELPRLGADHLSGRRHTSLNAVEYQRLTSIISRSRQRLSDLDSELARGLGASTLRHKLERQLQALRPIERVALRRSLPILQRHFVTAALVTARSFAYQQGHER